MELSREIQKMQKNTDSVVTQRAKRKRDYKNSTSDAHQKREKREEKLNLESENGGVHDFLRPVYTFQCSICFDDVEKSSKKGVRLLNCGHDFCETCIVTHIQMKVERGEVLPSQLRCPIPKCRDVHPSDVLLALKTEKQRDRFHRLTIQKFVDNDKESACCPGCEYKFWFDTSCRKLECPCCTKTYCISCRLDWHEVRKSFSSLYLAKS